MMISLLKSNCKQFVLILVNEELYINQGKENIYFIN